MTFTGYPFAADHEGDDSNLGTQAEAHNAVEQAANELQEQIIAMQTQMDGFASLSAAMTNFMALFNAPVAFTPVLVNVTVGAAPGEAWGRYIRLGNLVFIQGGFRLGAGFTMHATNPFGVKLPFNANLTSGGPARWPTILSYASNASANQRTSGAGIVLHTESDRVSRFANEATGLGWDGGSPYTWQTSDIMVFSGHYWAVPL